jgi:hypothetical protein
MRKEIPMPTYEVNLVPAYGRDYSEPAQVLRDWNAGKDFLIRDIGQGRDDGRYTSKEDWAGKHVRIRYNGLADFVIVKG